MSMENQAHTCCFHMNLEDEWQSGAANQIYLIKQLSTSVATTV